MSEPYECWLCHEPIEEDEEFQFPILNRDGSVWDIQYWHKECAKKTGVDKDKNKGKDKVVFDTHSNSEKSSEERHIEILRVFSWANLVVGILSGLILIFGYGIETRRYLTEYNPIAIFTGLFFLIEGIFGWALFMVVCSIAENLIAIRKNTSNQ
ncbi:MAG: hypothetical protein VR72_17780 [Clostridiaceae bacterium BRH_c20a]|nr:MAG: hypothetical protein VR72_17780 [Clostridiaceae bacterium BRH_c20a]